MRWLLLLVGLLAAPSLASTAEPTKPPNIVFLLADDLRADALGCAGNRLIQTPNIDALAQRGVLFQNHFTTTSICSVSRASILSGQYARRHQINDFAGGFTPAALAQTYPMLLRQAGYRTGFIGKYGVGNTLPDKEFDVWHGFAGQGAYFDTDDPLHLTRKMGDQAVNFLLGCTAKRPFCLSLSFKAPHAHDGAPREFPPDARDEKLYADVKIPVPLTAEAKYFQALPPFAQKSEGRVRWQRRFNTPERFQENARDYYRLVTGMDREVGRIVEWLRQRKLLDNTLLVFTADNGFFLGERGMSDKWLMYEPSIRIPLLVVPPGGLAQPQTVQGMTLNIDLAPTVLDYAGVQIPARMQGSSVRPLVEGKKATWRTEMFYEHHTLPNIIPPSEGVRTERWKYLRWVGVDPALEELYDLHTDPQETTNLVQDRAHEKTLTDLRARWAQLRKELQ